MTNYGWSVADACSVTDNQLVFTNSGLTVNELTYSKASDKTTVEAEFIHKNVDFGLVLWYNNEGYIKYVVSSHGLSIIRLYNGDEILLNTIAFNNSTLNPPVDDDIITLKSELSLTNIKCYYNGTLVFNFEQNAFSEGSFGVCGEQNAICTMFSIKGTAVSNWIRWWESDKTTSVVLEDGRFIFRRPEGAGLSSVYTSVPTTPGSTYTASVRYTGAIFIEAEGISTAYGTHTEIEDVLTLKFTATEPLTNIRIGPNEVGISTAYSPQLEEKSFSTSYTQNNRDRSLLTFPAGKVDRYKGSLSVYVKPLYNYESGILPIFYYNDALNMMYTDGSFVLKYGTATLDVPFSITSDTSYRIYVSWENGVLLSIRIDDNPATTMVPENEVIAYSENIMIGCTPTVSANAIFDALEIRDDINLVIETDFGKNTLGFTRNKIAISAKPKPGAPIILEDSDGMIYERVYFLYNGEYVLFDTIKAYVTGKTFRVGYDVLRADARLEDGTKIFTDIAISGNVIIINDLSDEDKGKAVIIEYTPSNCFCINHSKISDSYEIEISNVEGKDLILSYENEFGADKIFLQNIESNPFKAASNNGFVYVTDIAPEVVSLDVKATPSSVIADGHQIVTISIDCLAANGALTSNANVIITGARYGTVEKYISSEEQEFFDAFKAEEALHGYDSAVNKYGYFITDEHRSGRYVFKYKVNNIATNEVLIEKLTVVDTKSGIGTEVQIKIAAK